MKASVLAILFQQIHIKFIAAKANHCSSQLFLPKQEKSTQSVIKVRQTNAELDKLLWSYNSFPPVAQTWPWLVDAVALASAGHVPAVVPEPVLFTRSPAEVGHSGRKLMENRVVGRRRRWCKGRCCWKEKRKEYYVTALGSLAVPSLDRKILDELVM